MTVFGKARTELGAEAYGKSLNQSLSSMSESDKARIENLLSRMKLMEGLRSLSRTDALDLLAQIGFVLELRA